MCGGGQGAAGIDFKSPVNIRHFKTNLLTLSIWVIEALLLFQSLLNPPSHCGEDEGFLSELRPCFDSMWQFVNSDASLSRGAQTLALFEVRETAPAFDLISGCSESHQPEHPLLLALQEAVIQRSQQ